MPVRGFAARWIWALQQHMSYVLRLVSAFFYLIDHSQCSDIACASYFWCTECWYNQTVIKSGEMV